MGKESQISMGKWQTDPQNQENTLPETNSIMFSVGDLNQEEIERLAKAIIHVAVEESKLCSIPDEKIRLLQEAQENNQTRVEKKYAHYWIH